MFEREGVTLDFFIIIHRILCLWTLPASMPGLTSCRHICWLLTRMKNERAGEEGGRRNQAGEEILDWKINRNELAMSTYSRWHLNLHKPLIPTRSRSRSSSSRRWRRRRLDFDFVVIVSRCIPQQPLLYTPLCFFSMASFISPLCIWLGPGCFTIEMLLLLRVHWNLYTFFMPPHLVLDETSRGFVWRTSRIHHKTIQSGGWWYRGRDSRVTVFYSKTLSTWIICDSPALQSCSAHSLF